MGLLQGQEQTLKGGEGISKLIEETQRKMEKLIHELLIPGVTMVITHHHLADILKQALKQARFPLLSKYKNREVEVLDCKGWMSKKDANGMMARLAEKAEKSPSLIVVIENIADVWSDTSCEDPQYVENLFGHSWKNEQIYFGDCYIDRSQMTIILSAGPEHKDELEQKYRIDPYGWIEDFDVEFDALQNVMKNRC